jgi:hypothetical protein
VATRRPRRRRRRRRPCHVRARHSGDVTWCRRSRDSNRVAAIIVEVEDVVGHDLVPLAEPPPPAGQEQRFGAVEEDLRGP